MYIYWKTEKKVETWKCIEDTPENRQKAIDAGAMFFTWAAVSHPYQEGGEEPLRQGDMPLDFDDALKPTAALDDLRRLVAGLNEAYGVSPEHVRCFLSGSKGFHAEIPAELFGAQDGDPLLPLIYKHMAVSWINKFNLALTDKGKPVLDLALYNMRTGRMWRLPNVKRENGRHKVPLAWHEVSGNPFDYLQKLGEAPRTLNFSANGLHPNPALVELYRDLKTEVLKGIARANETPSMTDVELSRFRDRVSPCIDYILREKPKPEGALNFNALVMQLVIYFQMAGFSRSDAFLKAKDFLETYQESDTYNTPAARIRHFNMLWDYLQDHPSYKFHCDFLLGLKLPKVAYDCGCCLNDIPKIFAKDSDLGNLARNSWLAMQKANNPPKLFSHASGLVRIDHDGENELRLTRLNYDMLRGYLARIAYFFKTEKDDEGKSRASRVLPPEHLVKDMLVEADPPMPFLGRLVTHPVFTPDGNLHLQPGYNSESRCYFYSTDANLSLPTISEKPGAAELRQAVELLKEVVYDFPFAGDADRAHVIALMVLPFVYDMINDSTPMHNIESPKPGTGKSLLFDACAMISLGHICGKASQVRSNDEMRKLLLSYARDGKPYFAIDNFVGEISSPALASVITGRTVTDRILGISATGTFPVRMVFAMTSNNPQFSKEMLDRTIRIRLNARMQDPSSRDPRAFLHAHLLSWIFQNRGRIIGALCTIVRAWVAAGGPSSTRINGRFIKWSQVIGGILKVAEIEGFLENMTEFKEDSDAETRNVSALVWAWWEQHREEYVGSGDLYPIVIENNLDLGLRGKDEDGQRKSFGRFLATLKDQIFTFDEIEVTIKKAGVRNHAIQYKLKSSKRSTINAETDKTGGSGGFEELFTTTPHLFIKNEKKVYSILKTPKTPLNPPFADESAPAPLFGFAADDVYEIRDDASLRGAIQTITDVAPKKLFVDTESQGGTDPLRAKPVLIQVKAAECVYIIHVAAITDFAPLKALFETEGILIVGHNLKYDLKVLKIVLGDFKPHKLFCTLLAEQILAAGRQTITFGLKDLAERYCAVNLNKTMAMSFRQGENLSEGQLAYAVNDVLVLEPIYEHQKQALVDEQLIETALLEFGIIPAVADMELAGITVDKELAGKLRVESETEIKRIESELDTYLESKSIPPINYNSTQQLLTVLKSLGIGAQDCKRKTLEKIDHPFVNLRRQYKKARDLVSKLLKPLPAFVNPKTGRVHASFNQIGAGASGRFSCSKPNLQQIHNGQKYRALIRAAEGFKLVTADYSQIELRILAEFSDDTAMIEVFKSGLDLHAKTAADVAGIDVKNVTKAQRSAAKAVNFGLVYGKGVPSLAKDLGISEAQAQQIVSKVLDLYPQAKAFLNAKESEVMACQRIRTMGGRCRYFEEDYLQKFTNAAKREARNSGIQGTGADIMKQAILELAEPVKAIGGRMVLTVHDELVFEVPEDASEPARALIEAGMITAAQVYLKKVPVLVDIAIDSTWRK